MENSTLIFLGRDSGFGNKNNSAYFEEKNNLTIIDCGSTVFGEVKNKFDFSKYNNINVIITHLHNDHAGSLSQLILYLWFIHNKKVTVFSKCKNINIYLKITGVPEEAYEIKDESENIKFIETEHVKHLDAYGFKIKIENKNIIYTGDTNIIEPFLPYIDKTDELYIDVSRFGGGHLKIEDIFDKLLNIKEKRSKNIFNAFR